MKRTCAYLIASMMLITAIPAASPAMQAQASVHDRAAGTAVRSVQGNLKFVKKSGKVYCQSEDGTTVSGWVRISGKWYYFDKKDGHMITGWLKLGNSRKFYLKKDGSMIEGPCWYKIGTKKYFFTQNGHVRAAWENKNGSWYYIDTEGDVLKSKWVLYGGKYYYLTSSGAAAAGVKMINGQKFTFDSSCALTGAVPTSVRQAAKETSSNLSAASDVSTKIASADPVPDKTAKNGTSQKNTAASKKDATDSKDKTSAKEVRAEGKDTWPPAETDSKKSDSAAKKNDSAAAKTSAAKKASTSTTAAKTAITKVVGKLNSLPENKKNFTINIAKYVRKYAPKYGIKVYSPIIAQAIHESGWGESSLAWKYHNYFGLKCGTLWTGKSVNLSTKEEYTAGTLTTIRDNFRVYDNMEQGVIGYFEFIQRPRYANLKGVTSCEQYLINIKNDGYATGSLYVDHTMDVVNIYNLTQFDK